MKTVPEVIADFFGHALSEVKPESKLVDDLHFDSLDMIELVIELEDVFSIEIPAAEAEAWQTVQDVIATVQKLEIAKMQWNRLCQ